MSVPTRDSRTKPLISEVQTLYGQIAAARRVAVTQQSVLTSNTPIIDILEQIYIPFVQDIGFWNTLQRVRAFGGFSRTYLEEVGVRFDIGPNDVNLANNRIILGDNGFAVDDPVRFVEHDVLYAPLVEGTTYFVIAKPTTGTITISTTESGSELDITSSGTGSNVIRFGLNSELNTLETAMEAVIDEIITAVPVTVTTLEIRARKFDKLLVSSTDGFSDAVLTAAQTATLRTKLLDVQNAIEAPV